jgi:hypothetical protein
MTTISWLMLLREMIAVYYDNHTKHIHTLCGQNAEVMNVKLGGTYSCHFVKRHKEFLLQA